MADKINKALELLRNHYLQESNQALAQQQQSDDAAAPQNKKKDALLSTRDRINHCNIIADFLPLQTVREYNDFSRLLNHSMELLLICCDDNEADVRLLAGECINKITKAFLNSNIGRIQFELFKEIRKNGPSRSLRAAIQRFGDTSHLIRAYKCRPYVSNILPSIVKIAKREDDAIQEALAVMMDKLCPILGRYMIEPDVKILVKNFLPNLKSTSAVMRRTAVSMINAACEHSRKPSAFYSYLVTMLLGSVSPLVEDIPSTNLLGVLLCLRAILPQLSDEAQNSNKDVTAEKKMSTKKDKVVDKKQFLQIYEVTMFCTRHSDHNVVTASLETLNQILQCKSTHLNKILLSSDGISPDITAQSFGLLGERQYNNSPAPSEMGDAHSETGDSGFASDLTSLSSFSITSYNTGRQDDSISALAEGANIEDSVMKSNIPNYDVTPEQLKRDSSDGSIYHPLDDATSEVALGLELPRTYTTGSMVEIESEVEVYTRDSHLNSMMSDIPDRDSTCSLEELIRNDSVNSKEVHSKMESYFNLDAVACSGVPLLHCVRLMCSFLLHGQPGQLQPDSQVRVSVKALALNCISSALKLFPQALLACVMPTADDNTQVVRDVLLLRNHEDPHLRGLVSMLVASFLNASILEAHDSFDKWNESIAHKYNTTQIDIKELHKILLSALKDNSATAAKQACVAVKFCIQTMLQSSFHCLGCELAWKLLDLADSSYWLVKVEIMEVFGVLDYALLAYLRSSWLQWKGVARIAHKHSDLQSHVVDRVLMPALADEDARVRSKAAHSLVRIVALLHLPSQNDDLSLPCKVITPQLSTEQNLSFVIRKILQRRNQDQSKYFQLGSVQCLYLLSTTFPVSIHPLAWESLPAYTIKSQQQTAMRSVQPRKQLDFTNAQPSTTGLLSNVIDLMTSSWLSYDLLAHEFTLKLSVHLLCGASKKYLDEKPTQDEEPVDTTVGAEQWAVINNAELTACTKKIFAHIVKLLSILQHVIEHTNPLLSLKNREKLQEAQAPVTAIPQQHSTPPSANQSSVNSPRKFTLVKSMHRRTASDDKRTPEPSATEPKTNPNQPPPGEKFGFFQHIAHYVGVYYALKGAYKNYQVAAVTIALDKFGSFVRGTLEAFSMLLELATFQELSAYTDEMLEYFKVSAVVEEEATFLAVQQLLKALFGTNVASQPQAFKLPESVTQLTEHHGDPTFAYALNVQKSCPEAAQAADSLFDGCFLSGYEQMQESMKHVPQVLEKGSRALSLLKSFKNSFTTNRPSDKVSKERLSSIQSNIRLFEPLVILALKSYTTTSSTRLQCQAIHLLEQLVRLRVNYSLLDSDQVFIGFVLKQFNLIEQGQVREPELFVSSVFQFLVLLSYECYQPKHTQAKAIIGMPRIMRLCDSVMASGQPPLKYAIPALQPIVQDLFASKCQLRADTSKELDTQREVVVSMLLRVTNYPQVLKMLQQVLVGSKNDDEKWKKLSRQIVDTLLPCLAKLEIKFTSLEDLYLLFDLLDSVAPLALRPVDIILKTIFSAVSNMALTSKECLHTLGMVIGLLRTLIMQNSEEIILSRAQQIDTAAFFATLNAPALKTKINEHAAANLIAAFLVRVLQRSVDLFTHDSEDLLPVFVSKYLPVLTYITKSGLFKKISSSLLTKVLAEDPALATSLTSITNMLTTTIRAHPHCFLQWCYFVHALGVSDNQFWVTLYTELKEEQWRDTIVKNAVFVLYCDVITTKLKTQKNAAMAPVHDLLTNHTLDLIHNLREAPVKQFISRIFHDMNPTHMFICKLHQYLTPNFIRENALLMTSLLYHLEHVELVCSGALVQLLLCLLPHVKMYGVARKLETLACRRMEYLNSLNEKEQQLSETELIKFSDVALFNKRYPRLCSLIKRIIKQKKTSNRTHSHPLDQTDIDLSKYYLTQEWMVEFVTEQCTSETINSQQAVCCLQLLRTLSLSDINKIINHQKFGNLLLEKCLDQNNYRDLAKHTKRDTEVLHSYETVSPRENKGQMQQLATGKIIERISRLCTRVRTTRDQFVAFDATSFDEILTKDNNLTSLARCVNLMLYPSCYLNKPAKLSQLEVCDILELALLMIGLCVEELHRGGVDVPFVQLSFHTLSLVLHCQEFKEQLEVTKYKKLIMSTVRDVHILLSRLTVREGEELAKLPQVPVDEYSNSEPPPKTEFEITCGYVSELVESLKTHLSQDAVGLPSLILKDARIVIIGLARWSLVNSHARIPPIVWRFGWQPLLDEGVTELPPLPVDILKEKDVLKDFVFRVNHIGWTSRMQFEETWAALLGVLSAPPMVENTSTEEEIELAQASCLAVHCITSLILDTTFVPVPGNPAISRHSVIHRSREYLFLGSKAGKKLWAVRSLIEDTYRHKTCAHERFLPVVPNLLSAKQRKQQLQNGCLVREKLFGANLELTLLHTFGLGQISASAIRTRLVTSDVQEDTDSDDSDSLIIKVKEQSPQVAPQQPDFQRKLEELDIRSCLQFLLELFEQWLSPYVVPKTPLMLKMEAVKSLCILSDFLLEMSHYEWVLSILLDFSQNHPVEDEILLQYLVPTICKSLAVLKLEGVYVDRIIKQLEQSLKSPHIPLQMSCMIGSLYILESQVSATSLLLVPLLTEYITQKLPAYLEGIGTSDERFSLVFWSTCFYLVENCSSEITDSHFATLILEKTVVNLLKTKFQFSSNCNIPCTENPRLVLVDSDFRAAYAFSNSIPKSVINQLCKTSDDVTPAVSDVMFRGLERLAISFALTHVECERLAKLSANCILNGSAVKMLPALSLLCSCMYTGKDAEQASGLSSIDVVVDAPITDSRLLVMERINVLLSRIRKGEIGEANLLASILPRILLDFLPVQEVMNKLISEFLSSQQPRPELIAKIFYQVSHILYREGEGEIVKEWVYLCVGSFVQRTPISMAVWSLTCFFICASNKPALKSLFSFVVLNKGKLNETNKKIFCMAALDFYTNQKLDTSQKQQFVQILRTKSDSVTSHYEDVIACCLEIDRKEKVV